MQTPSPRGQLQPGPVSLTQKTPGVVGNRVSHSAVLVQPPQPVSSMRPHRVWLSMVVKQGQPPSPHVAEPPPAHISAPVAQDPCPVTHWRCAHSCPAPQALPQLPQWLAFLVVSTHLPPQHSPPAHAVPLGFFFLHLPFLRFLHGGHGFFLLFFLAAAASLQAAPRAPPSAPLRRALSAWRREPAAVKDRVRVSKCAAAMAGSLAGRGGGGGQTPGRRRVAIVARAVARSVADHATNPAPFST